MLQAPCVVTVAVELRKCNECQMYGWASDNWRETGVFNYNNYYLVEVSLLYKCLAKFLVGLPIQLFFSTLLKDLTTDHFWLHSNPDHSKRFEQS